MLLLYMGIPHYILTDNMKSVVIRRDPEGHPIWQKDYKVFMETIGFQTKLCKPRHPFTKGKVERLIRFVKDNFLAGRVFGTITELNLEAIGWCKRQNSIYHKAVDCIPCEKHQEDCMAVASVLQKHRHLLSISVRKEKFLSMDLSIMKGGASASRTGTPRRPAGSGEIPLPSISTHPISAKS